MESGGGNEGNRKFYFGTGRSFLLDGMLEEWTTLYDEFVTSRKVLKGNISDHSLLVLPTYALTIGRGLELMAWERDMLPMDEFCFILP